MILKCDDRKHDIWEGPLTVDITADIGQALLQWLYTDDLNIAEDDSFLLKLMKAATTYQLTALVNRYPVVFLLLYMVDQCFNVVYDKQGGPPCCFF